MRTLALWLALVLTGNGVAAEDPAAIVTEAFATLSGNVKRDWAFTETRTSEGVAWVGRWDPRDSVAPWQLLSVDGRAPTDEERQQWLSAHEPGTGDDEGVAESDIITPDTLWLIEETDEAWLFGFAPTDDDAESAEFMNEVDGRLRVMRDGHWLAELLLENHGPIRPATGVKISRFETRLRFGPVGPHGDVLPLAIDVHVKGRAYLAISFEEREIVRYGDYEKVVTPAD